MEDNLEDNELPLVEQNNLEYFIPIDISNLDGVKLNKKKFQEGLDDFSYYAGVISALTNSGVSSTDAVSWVLNGKTLASNKEMQEIINTNNIEVAKIQATKVDNLTL